MNYPLVQFSWAWWNPPLRPIPDYSKGASDAAQIRKRLSIIPTPHSNTVTKSAHCLQKFCIVHLPCEIPDSRIDVKTSLLLLSLLPLLAYRTASVNAQPLPAPSRVIYKCEVGGKIAYTDEPCFGAKRMDIQPSRGLDKFSGKQMTGTDVRQENHRDMMADGIAPIAGLSRQEFAAEVHRHNLNANAKTECRALDPAIAQGEAVERTSSRDALPAVQGNLLLLRKRYKELGC
jgi:hypothetical protein